MDIITMIGNTGTYLDSPFHRYEGGADLAGLDLATLVDLPAEVFHADRCRERGIPAEVFYDRDVRGHGGAPAHRLGRALRHARVRARRAVPHRGRRRSYLVEQGVVLVGIDSLNIDDTESGGERPAHTGLLAAGIHVVEHLTSLGELPAARRALHGGAAGGRGIRHLPGAGLRDAQLTEATCAADRCRQHTSIPNLRPARWNDGRSTPGGCGCAPHRREARVLAVGAQHLPGLRAHDAVDRELGFHESHWKSLTRCFVAGP